MTTQFQLELKFSTITRSRLKLVSIACAYCFNRLNRGETVWIDQATQTIGCCDACTRSAAKNASPQRQNQPAQEWTFDSISQAETWARKYARLMPLAEQEAEFQTLLSAVTIRERDEN